MKRTITYTIVGLLSPLITFLLLPVYLKYLSTSEYVIIALSNSFITIFFVFFNLKVDQAMRTLFFYDKENTEKQTTLFSTLFTFQLISFCIWALIFLIIGNPLFSILYKNQVPFFPYSFVILCSFLINSLCSFYFIYLQNNLEVKKYCQYFIASTILIHGLQLSSIFILKLTFLWFLLAPLLANAFIFCIIIVKNSSLFKLQVSKSVLNESLRFSIPFVPFLILYNLESQLDRFFIDTFLSINQLASYAALLSIVSVISLLFNSVDNAIRPELFRLLSSENNKYKLQQQIDFYVMAGLVALSFLVFFGVHIHWFLNNPRYNGIAVFFPWIGIAFLPLVFLRFFALQLIFENKVHKMNLFSLVKIGLMTLLFWVFIPKFGIHGAIYTLVFSNFINASLFFVLLKNRILPIKKILLYCIVFLLLCIVLCGIESSKWLSLVALFMVLLYSVLFLQYYKMELKNYFQKKNSIES